MEHKSSSKILLIAAIALVVLGVGGAAYALTRPAQEQSTNETKTESSASPASLKNMGSTTTTDTSDVPTIVFTDDGFSQSTYTFPAGQNITVENKSSMDMQFSSDDHPSHRDHTELNLPVVGAGESASFTPAGKGTYGFHDHINDQFEGTLVIE